MLNLSNISLMLNLLLLNMSFPKMHSGCTCVGVHTQVFFYESDINDKSDMSNLSLSK